ncbi:MAG: hypothetical protein ACO31Z_09150 [Litorivicinaceae bacterium]
MDTRSAPSIATRPGRVRGVTDLLRLLPYLKPHRLRWTAMVVAAMVGLVATVAIPLPDQATLIAPAEESPIGLSAPEDQSAQSPVSETPR